MIATEKKQEARKQYRGKIKPTPQMFNIADTARYLGVSQASFYKLKPALTKAGVRPVQLPNLETEFYRKRDLDEWMADLPVHENEVA